MTCAACSQPLNACPCPDMVAQGLIPHSNSPRVAPRAGAGDTPPIASPTTVTALGTHNQPKTGHVTHTHGAVMHHQRQYQTPVERAVGITSGVNDGEAGHKSTVAHATSDSAQAAYAATRLTMKAHDSALKPQKILQRTINHSLGVV